VIYYQRSPFALNESYSLGRTNEREYGGKSAYDSGPSEHGPIKAALLIAVAALGAWIGVWSIVFWDWLRGWRWIVSALGWIVMISCIIQGLSVHP
jgi:hypothetical protein